ncbi:hypothetical protein POSPLADRAFT_1177457 [Postia placenta MAD-698-R-SB12]|uniref:Uncharacterized protein n=1 Tax=Postia placenta MAD-698-R-SB12 TaxID=670580 RepID=A0A1X6NBJ1_9APHY|nr:hypothetical protein POSPLADRAFT_1177457 [Postia placenta MAD-698-R-SB12]OSX66007.1 hypothetical protein POSPLADRAFT_1177457 [Postia placenta MAD-698-R-SB12]
MHTMVIAIQGKGSGNSDYDAATLRSRSLAFAPGPNRSWKLISSSINSSIIFMVVFPESEGPDFGAIEGTLSTPKSRKTSTILAMAPLPLGTASHPTDHYNLIALLTPIKLVIVGLKPSPRTWYRRHREGDEKGGRSKFKGVLAWYPSVIPGSNAGAEVTNKKDQVNGSDHPASTMPMLIYSWGDTLFLMRLSEDKVQQQTRNARTGKINSVEVGRVVFEETRQWNVGDNVLALQWLNVNQVLVLTAASLEVHDVRTAKLVEQVPYDAWSLVSPILSHTTNGTVSYSDAVMEIAHSLRIYKGKIFTLGQSEVRVGTLLTWADRILSFVQDGDFLSAIELTRSYYTGECPGNRNSLPESPEQLKVVVGEKMRELMVASARYAFSEERMTDGTHVTRDGRGVDRTLLFEGLVKTCARACSTLDDYDFLFEELFQFYDDNGIARIFLLQLEPFVLDSVIRHVPPWITQRLIALHDNDGHPELVERVIWHIDPECLDVNQVIKLCQRHALYDALIYIFTRAVKDFKSPVVELLGLVRKVQQYRRSRRERSSPDAYVGDENIEHVVLNAYKIYPYLANTLTGLSYPSAESLPEDEAFQAKDAVYTFLFLGRSSVWPLGEGGKLILTADEDNGVEPTYPYTRLLLRFDPEAFLHTLDLAFEDAYLNDETRGVSRLVIVKILLDILSSPDLSPAEATFVNIFIARNVPKYPQFIQIPPSALHSILINLAEDPDPETREDRQLAAEYLLSTYNPHESDRIVAIFERAGFYRILRSWYYHERKWAPLLLTYLDDSNLPVAELFRCIDDALESARSANKGSLSRDLEATFVNSLPSLLNSNIVDAAALVDKHFPSLHDRAVQELGRHSERDQHAYLRFLLGSPPRGEEDGYISFRKGGPSPYVPPPLRLAFISLQCQFEPTAVIPTLRYLPPDFLDADDVAAICEEHSSFDAVIWVLGHAGKPLAALSKAEGFSNVLSARLAEMLVGPVAEDRGLINDTLSKIDAMGRNAVGVCLEHSQATSNVEVPLEDMWYQLLRSQIDTVQRVASCCLSLEDKGIDGTGHDEQKGLQQQSLSALRLLVQETFASLMTISSAKAVSLPRLFKRLLTATSANSVSKPTLYAEFRMLFTGMLEAYRSDGDMLIITKHLVDDSVFAAIQELAQERIRGWAPSQGKCGGCGEAFVKKKQSNDQDISAGAAVIVSRTGAIYHSKCLPSESS